MPRKDQNSSKPEVDKSESREKAEPRANLPQRNLKSLKYEFQRDLLRQHAEAHAPAVAADLQQVALSTVESERQEFLIAYGYWSLARDGYGYLLRVVRASQMEDDDDVRPTQPTFEGMTEFRGTPRMFLVQLEPGLFASLRKQDATVDQSEDALGIFNRCIGKSQRVARRWKKDIDRGRELEGRFGKGLSLAELNRLAEIEADQTEASSGE